MEPQSSQLAYAIPSNQRPLNVLFDGRKLGDGGIGVYIESTITGLLHCGDIALTVIGSKDQAGRAGWSEDVAWIYDSTKPYSLSEYMLLARKIDFSNFDLFHAPHYTLPFGIPVPSVVTIHDLIHIEHPQRFYYPLVAKPLISSAVRRAAAVVAVSHDTKLTLARHVTGAESKVEVIPNTIPDFNLSSSKRDADVVGLAGASPYFVAVLSNLKPHKGLADLVAAYTTLHNRLTIEGRSDAAPRLLLVGYGVEKLKADRELWKKVSRENSGIVVVGSVTRAQLAALYAGSLGVVIPSRAEGFCLPALEAQSVGARVVCRPVPAVCELLTERDLVAKDLSQDALAAVMREAVLNPSTDRSIYRDHLDRYSRANTTERLVSVYHRIVSPELRERAV